MNWNDPDRPSPEELALQRARRDEVLDRRWAAVARRCRWECAPRPNVREWVEALLIFLLCGMVLMVSVPVFLVVLPFILVRLALFDKTVPSGDRKPVPKCVVVGQRPRVPEHILAILPEDLREDIRRAQAKTMGG